MSVFVQVGRQNDNKRIEVLEGTTILAAMVQGGYNRQPNEKIIDIENNEYSGAEVVSGGMGYFLFEPLKNGQ